MKNITLTVLAFLITVFGIALATYADKDYCPQNAVHCAYMTGLSDDLNDGRYIKLTNARVSLTVCFNGTGVAFIDQMAGHRFMGPNADTYSICSHANGTGCEEIGVDMFDVFVNQGWYSSRPPFYSIDVSTLKDQYPTCDSLDNALSP